MDLTAALALRPYRSNAILVVGHIYSCYVQALSLFAIYICHTSLMSLYFVGKV